MGKLLYGKSKVQALRCMQRFSTNVGNVYALCAFGSTLFAAGTTKDGGIDKPVWWHIAGDGTVTENKLGTAKGEAFGICVTPQE